MTNLSSRPRPIKAAASKLSTVLGSLGALAAALASWGVVTAAQHDALNGLLGLLGVVAPGVIAAATAVLTAFGVVRSSEPLVTPLKDPRNNAGAALTAPSPPGDFGSGVAGD